MYIQYLAESFHNSPNWKLFDSAWTPHLRDVQGAARAFRWLAVEGFDVPGQDLRKTRVALTQRLLPGLMNRHTTDLNNISYLFI